jgi:NAD(P) transhydrogenase subunit alpha
MMTTAAGTTKAAKVLILGAGVAGLQAIATCRRLGAEVTAFDIRPETKEQVESLGASFLEEQPEQDEQEAAVQEEEPEPGLVDRLREAFGLPPREKPSTNGAAAAADDDEDEAQDSTSTGGYAREQAEEKQRRDREMIKRYLGDADVVITTALVPGRPAPKLLTREMVDAMPPGSVVVDLAAEAGGNCELTRPGEVVEQAQVRVHGPLNLPSSVPIHASQFYSRNVLNVLSHLVDEGELKIDFEDEITDASVVTHAGEVRHGPTREALGLPAQAERQST